MAATSPVAPFTVPATANATCRSALAPPPVMSVKLPPRPSKPCSGSARQTGVGSAKRTLIVPFTAPSIVGSVAVAPGWTSSSLVTNVGIALSGIVRVVASATGTPSMSVCVSSGVPPRTSATGGASLAPRPRPARSIAIDGFWVRTSSSPGWLMSRYASRGTTTSGAGAVLNAPRCAALTEPIVRRAVVATACSGMRTVVPLARSVTVACAGTKPGLVSSIVYFSGGT